MAIKHIILGALMNGPAHGYSFRSGTTSRIMEEFGINDGQLYPLLKKMTDEGLIEKVIEYRESGPNRHNYHITDAGKDEFFAWISGDADEGRAFRYELIRQDEFIVKCMYLKFLEPAKSLEKIQKQINETESVINDYKNAYDDMSGRGFNKTHLMIVRYCIMNLETRVNWLRELEIEFSLTAKGKKNKN